MKKVLLVGNFGSRNVGDEIILWTALQKYPDAIVMTADADFSRRFLQVEALHATPLRPTFIPPFPTGIRSFLKFLFNKKSREIFNFSSPDSRESGLRKINKIIFPGGGLLAIKLHAYLIWAIMVWWLRRYFPNAEIIFEHQGIDETSCPLKKAITKYIFKYSNKISVRDKISRDFLQSLYIKSVEDSDRVEKFLKENSPLTKGVGGISKNLVLINACRQNPAAPRKAVAKFSDLCTPETLPRGTSAVFVCFDPSDAKYVPQGFKGRIVFPENIAETFKLFQRAKMAIGQRLHFLILANHFCGAENTFTLGQPYSQKVENFAGKYNIKPFLTKK